MSIIINTESDTLHNQIKKECKKNGITLKELCEKSNISYNSLSHWKNENPTTIKKLYAMEKTLSELKGNKFHCKEKNRCINQCYYCYKNQTNKK